MAAFFPITQVDRRKIGFRALSGRCANIDAATAGGRLVFGLFAALAEFCLWMACASADRLAWHTSAPH
jgi:hypothetical protein